MKIKFRFPNTRWCFVLWYRNNQAHETHIPTPANPDMLQNEMLRHRVGYSEIRAVKADDNSGLRDVSQVNAEGLTSLMTRF